MFGLPLAVISKQRLTQNPQPLGGFLKVARHNLGTVICLCRNNEAIPQALFQLRADHPPGTLMRRNNKAIPLALRCIVKSIAKRTTIVSKVQSPFAGVALAVQDHRSDTVSLRRKYKALSLALR